MYPEWFETLEGATNKSAGQHARAYELRIGTNGRRVSIVCTLIIWLFWLPVLQQRIWQPALRRQLLRLALQRLLELQL